MVMLAIREHRFPFLMKVGDWNRFNRYTGGTLVEKCCHFFDLMRLLMRCEPVRIYASASVAHNHRDERYPEGVPDILDNAFVTVDFAGGQRASLDLCMFAEGSRYQEEISAVGPRGKAECFVPGPGRFWSLGWCSAPASPRGRARCWCRSIRWPWRRAITTARRWSSTSASWPPCAHRARWRSACTMDWRPW